MKKEREGLAMSETYGLRKRIQFSLLSIDRRIQKEKLKSTMVIQCREED